MGWQFTKWYAVRRVRFDNWERLTLFVVIAAIIFILGRYPFYIILAGGLPLAVLAGWLLRRRRVRRMRLS
jgi:uncharacterized membrane protein